MRQAYEVEAARERTHEAQVIQEAKQDSGHAKDDEGNEKSEKQAPPMVMMHPMMVHAGMVHPSLMNPNMVAMHPMMNPMMNPMANAMMYHQSGNPFTVEHMKASAAGGLPPFAGNALMPHMPIPAMHNLMGGHMLPAANMMHKHEFGDSQQTGLGMGGYGYGTGRYGKWGLMEKMVKMNKERAAKEKKKLAKEQKAAKAKAKVEAQKEKQEENEAKAKAQAAAKAAPKKPAGHKAMRKFGDYCCGGAYGPMMPGVMGQQAMMMNPMFMGARPLPVNPTMGMLNPMMAGAATMEAGGSPHKQEKTRPPAEEVPVIMAASPAYGAPAYNAIPAYPMMMGGYPAMHGHPMMAMVR